MKKLGELLTRHRNIFLLTLLVITMVVSGMASREQLESAATVNIPVTETLAQSSSALETYRRQRDHDTLTDMEALEALCAQTALDARTREDAAAQLQTIIDNRQMQSTLEGALLDSSLYPCVAVVAGGNVTIVTSKNTVTDKDSALVMTLAAAHAGASPENVRVITAK